MDESLQSLLAGLSSEVRATTIPSECKDTAVWCIVQLPTLYVKFRQTSENRYGNEITRLVRGVLKELVTTKTACPEALQLAASITARLRLLHEQLGLPTLHFELPVKPSPRSRKASLTK